jgi:hypothetical protein
MQAGVLAGDLTRHYDAYWANHDDDSDDDRDGLPSFS